MDKFSKLNRKKSPNKKREVIEYENDFIKINKFNDWTFITGNDCVFCIPYLIEENKFIIREEYIPTFEYKDGSKYHLSLVGGVIEEDETPIKALYREVEEEAGLIIRPEYSLIEELAPMYTFKNSAVKFYLYILPLNSIDFEETVAKGDGSKVERMSKSVKVDVSNIDRLLPSDIMTDYMLMKLKEYLNI